MLTIHRNMYGTCKHTYTNKERERHNKRTLTDTHTLRCRITQSASSVMGILHGGRCCFRSTFTAQHHSADDSSPSLPPSSCLPAVREEKNTTYPSFSLSHLNRIKTIDSPLLGLRNVCPPVSQSMDVPPSSLPISCSQPLGGDAQHTSTSQLPPFCGHMIWATTK